MGKIALRATILTLTIVGSIILTNIWHRNWAIRHMQELFSANVEVSYTEPTTVDEALLLLYQATGENYSNMSNTHWFYMGLVTDLNTDLWYLDVTKVQDFSCKEEDLSVPPTVVDINLLKNYEIVHTVSTRDATWRIEEGDYKTELYTPNFRFDILVSVHSFECEHWWFSVSSTYIGP